ncbi:RNA-directed DNA polymerase, eukaryota, reverse transcriptase zinc-binding domain protein [Tanacetum coccineum]
MDLDGVLVLPLVSDDEEAIRIVGDEELLSNVVEASVDSLKDDSLRRSMFLVVAKDGKRTKDPHLDEIIKLLPFGVGTCSFGFHMSLEPETTKVDFEKAFDSVKWDYLDETLKAFGFGLKWHNWISSCLNNAMGSVLVNGSPTLEFQFHKGLKQGLKINLHKSKLMGIGVSSNAVATAASLIGCSILTAPFNYLGVKVGSNMSRINSWDDVISKVSSRLSKWKLKLLSIGGRLTLLKSVLTSILLYHMSIFKILIGVLNHLESIRRNFFYYGVDMVLRKLAWIGWNMVSKPLKRMVDSWSL